MLNLAMHALMIRIGLKALSKPDLPANLPMKDQLSNQDIIDCIIEVDSRVTVEEATAFIPQVRQSIAELEQTLIQAGMLQ